MRVLSESRCPPKFPKGTLRLIYSQSVRTLYNWKYCSLNYWWLGGLRFTCCSPIALINYTNIFILKIFIVFNEKLEFVIFIIWNTQLSSQPKKTLALKVAGFVL